MAAPKNRKDEKKLDRLILAIFKRPRSIQGLARQLKLSERTIQRYLKHIDTWFAKGHHLVVDGRARIGVQGRVVRMGAKPVKYWIPN